ncbi:MAG: HAMP domain-containing protein [Planctomycetes bacterium]|nr:HAMP domain-containing protein [Planctomycetota bacterium]MCC7399798.1 HAMP domain-containing protein [Planctomycetota bacterium]
MTASSPISAAKRHGRFTSLGWRLTVMLAGSLIMASAVASWLSARQLEQRLLAQAKATVLRISDVVQRSTRYTMLQNRTEDTLQTVQDIGGQPGIEHVRIYNKAGKIVYSSRAAEIDHVVDLKAEACYQCHTAEQPLAHLDSPQRARIFQGSDQRRVLAAIDVVYNEANCSTAGCHSSPEEQQVLGVVDVGVSLRDIDAQIEQAGRTTLFFALAATAVACLLMAGFVFTFVTRPVRLLLDGIRRVSAGKLDATIDVGSADEVGQLAGAFNQMTADLRVARAEIDTWTRTLEQQVEQKTRDLRVAQDQVVRAEKLSSLGILAAGVAHELNSPLTGILTFGTLLLQDTPKGTRQHEDLQLIVNETNRCAAIIRQLLEFSRETGPQKRSMDLTTVVKRAVALVEHQAKFHNVKITTELPTGLPTVSCDGNQMEQVFLNLLINAADAMPNGGGIVVRASVTAAGRFLVQVTDTGTGIPPEILSKIFDPFFTSKPVGKGTGLGLSVSYGIVRRHGGAITVQSTVGTGSTFTVDLPVEAPPAAPAAGAAGAVG